MVDLYTWVGEMSTGNVPAELLKVRAKIDQLDRKLVELLAIRFALTQKVGLIKANKELEAFDADREAQKLAELRSLCEEHHLNPELITKLFTSIMEEVVCNHRRLRNE